jgi:hypothetical protein
LKAQKCARKNETNKMKTITKFGLAALAAGAIFASTIPATADEYASETSNYFTKHGLPVPGGVLQE